MFRYCTQVSCSNPETDLRVEFFIYLFFCVLLPVKIVIIPAEPFTRSIRPQCRHGRDIIVLIYFMNTTGGRVSGTICRVIWFSAIEKKNQSTPRGRGPRDDDADGSGPRRFASNVGVFVVVAIRCVSGLRKRRSGRCGGKDENERNVYYYVHIIIILIILIWYTEYNTVRGRFTVNPNFSIFNAAKTDPFPFR